MIQLPGLTDIHVHLRDPGQTQKEDFYTGTSAALAGGFTTVCDMPNNAEPITTLERIQAKRDSATKQVVCDIGFFFGSLGDNLDEFAKVKSLVRGLKLYLNQTTGGFIIDTAYLNKIFTAWNDNERPILLHAEYDVIEIALDVAAKTGQRIHVCHVSSQNELEPIIQAKKSGVDVTCGITPHHLFLIDKDVDRLGVYGQMKPPLKSQEDQDYLWSHFADFDIIESDHAPHTHEEKKEGAHGVPGLETTLPLLLQAERDGKLKREDIIEKCSTKPREILRLPAEVDSQIEVEEEEYIVRNDGLKTKCGWTPFEGKTVFGRVKTVTIRDEKVYENGEVLAKPGSGKLL